MFISEEITKYCEDYLQVENFSDYCHNGRQVEGAKEVSKIITGVSLSKKLIDKAIEKKAQMIIVHHGFFLDAFGNPPVVKGVVYNRLKLLLDNNINLLGFHLPLDAHPEIGNNVSICKKLKIKKLKKFKVGFIGELNEKITFDNFLEKVDNLLATKSYIISAGGNEVKKIAVISGAASSNIEEAKKMGADVFLSGDVQENTVRTTEELKINFINAGHYNTEKFGVQNLGRLIAQKFNLEVEYVDIPNEI